MLVLSRKKNQSIVIDGGIEIQVLQVKGGTVKLGIKAPENVRIVRGELEVYPEMIAAEESSEGDTLDAVGHASTNGKMVLPGENALPLDRVNEPVSPYDFAAADYSGAEADAAFQVTAK